jgi:hypothetical protein
MSLWDDVEPEVAAIVTDAGTALATWLWHKLTNDKETESAKRAITAIADKAKQAAVAAALEHLQQLAGALDIPDALAKLAAGAQGVQDEWAAAEARGRARMTSTLEPPAPVEPGEEPSEP